MSVFRTHASWAASDWPPARPIVRLRLPGVEPNPPRNPQSPAIIPLLPSPLRREGQGERAAQGSAPPNASNYTTRYSKLLPAPRCKGSKQLPYHGNRIRHRLWCARRAHTWRRRIGLPEPGFQTRMNTVDRGVDHKRLRCRQIPVQLLYLHCPAALYSRLPFSTCSLKPCFASPMKARSSLSVTETTSIPRRCASAVTTFWNWPVGTKRVLGV